MRILMIGAGGVGDAAARIAVERDFFELLGRRRLRPRRAEATVAARDGPAGGGGPPRRRPGRRLRRGGRGRPRREHAVDPRVQRRRPAVRHADLPRCPGGRGGLPRHGDEPVAAPPRASRTPRRTSSSATSSWRWQRSGRRPASWPCWAWGSSPGCPTCSPGMPPTTCSRTSTSSAPATVPTSRSATRTATRPSPPGSRCGRSSRSASTRRWCGSGRGPTRPVVTSKRASSRCQPFSEPEVFDFPEGIGPVECVHVEHEEVLLMPRWVDADRVTFKYGLGEELITILRTLRHARAGPHRPGDRQGSGGVAARRRGRGAARTRRRSGPLMTGKTCAGLLGHRHGQGRSAAAHLPLPRVRQRGHDARVRRPVRRLADGGEPVVALELLATGVWSGGGVLGPEAFDAVPFLDLLAAPQPAGYGSPWGMEDRRPAGSRRGLGSAHDALRAASTVRTSPSSAWTAATSTTRARTPTPTS